MHENTNKEHSAHRQKRRKELMRNAATVLLRNGLQNTTMEQIAGAVGISKVVYYRYFGTRDKLIHAVLGDIVDQLLNADKVRVDDWRDRMPACLEIARSNENAIKLLLRNAAHDPVYGSHYLRVHDVLAERARHRQIALLAGENQAGSTRPVSAFFLADATISLIFDSYVRWLDEGDPNKDAEFVDWIVESVRAMAHYWAGKPLPEA